MSQRDAGLKKLKYAVVALSLLGVAISAVALFEHLVYSHGLAQGPSFCTLSAHVDCQKVNASEYSSFLGLPVASYGIFFYLSLLGATLVSGGVAFSLAAFADVVFLAGTAASILSIVLFLLSELVIGALCLLCLGLYVVNFLIWAISWRSGRGRPAIKRLLCGAAHIFALPRAAIFGEGEGTKGKALAAIGALLFVGAVNVILPGVLLKFLEGGRPKPGDPVAAWRAAPIIPFQMPLTAGAFGEYDRGPVDAPIQLVEFADFECPACRRMFVALEPVLKKYDGRYHFVFRNFPLDNACNPSITRQFHQYACVAAHFSRCAGEQGKFWEALEFLFSYEGLEGEKPLEEVSRELVEKGSTALSLDPISVRECIDTKRYLKSIQSDIDVGDRVGIPGTPSFVVNGRLVPHPSPEVLGRIFDAVLKGAS